MRGGLTGHYVPFPSTGSEKARAFVPNPLPSMPPLETSGSALRVHRLLQVQPILSIVSAGEELKLNVPIVTASLKHLAKLGIVRETTGRNYGRIYAHDKCLKILKGGTEALN